jgi:hypothetical protein
MEVKTPKYNSSGTIDMEISHPMYGWIPFTATPDDVEELGRVLYADAINGVLGPIAAYVAPPEPTAAEILEQKRASASLTRREFFLGLDAMGIYDVVINATLPRAAKIELDTATAFERNWPTLIEMAVSLGFTDADLDNLFGIMP